MGDRFRNLPAPGELSYFGPAIRSETGESCVTRAPRVMDLCGRGLRMRRASITVAATYVGDGGCVRQRVGKYVNNQTESFLYIYIYACVRECLPFLLYAERYENEGMEMFAYI